MLKIKAKVFNECNFLMFKSCQFRAKNISLILCSYSYYFQNYYLKIGKLNKFHYYVSVIKNDNRLNDSPFKLQ